MSHFAEIDGNGTVKRVIVAEQDFIDSGAVGDAANWIQTSYNNNIRKQFAGIGFTYDSVKDKFIGPRFMARIASLEMHPMDSEDRIPEIKEKHGAGMCNITRCCTEVGPEEIQITDDAIIPLKERVVDRYFDPFMILFRKIFKK